MNEENKNKIHYFSTRNKNYKLNNKNSYKYLNTISQNFKYLTPLEKKFDILTLSKYFIKSNTTANSKNNSLNKNYTIDKNLNISRNYKPQHLNINQLSSNILSYNNKKNYNNNKIHNSYNNLKINVEEKAKIMENDRISKIKEKIEKKNEKIHKILEEKKLLDKKKNVNEEIKNERKNLKIKMYKLINNKGQLCQNFIKKNDNYNLRFINYLNSNHYIKSKKLFNDNFHFSKNDLDKAHDYYKQYLNTYSISKNSINIKDIFNALNNKDKKIIEKEPNYFFRNNKFLEELNDLEKKPLITTLIEEEEIQNMIKNKMPKKEIEKYKEKNDIINQRIKEYDDKMKKKVKKEELSYIYDDISQFINKNTLENIKNEFDLKLKLGKKNINELINDELKKYERNKEENNLAIYEKNKRYNKTYNKKINFYTKLKILDNNSKRLDKEDIFQIKRKKNKIEEKGDKYINDLKTKIMNIYNSDKSDKEDNNELFI